MPARRQVEARGGDEPGPTSSAKCPYCQQKDFSGDRHYPPCENCDDLNHAACVCTEPKKTG